MPIPEARFWVFTTGCIDRFVARSTENLDVATLG